MSTVAKRLDLQETADKVLELAENFTKSVEEHTQEFRKVADDFQTTFGKGNLSANLAMVKRGLELLRDATAMLLLQQQQIVELKRLNNQQNQQHETDGEIT